MVASLLAAMALCLAATAAEAQAIRRNVNDLSTSDVAALRRGVAVMMSRDNAPRGSADWRRSWQFWVNMHGYFSDTGQCRGALGDQTGMSTIELWSTSNTAEQRTWCACRHNIDAFLTWHRMYLVYFERVLRQAAGSNTLRLPYWDERGNGQLPAIYRAASYVNSEGQTAPNPLRIADRRPTLNDGSARLSTVVTSAANAMTATTFRTFRQRLEQTPHGSVHCAIVTGGCPNGIMGSVGVSPMDPVFWAHHTNIDRLYECWLRSQNGRLPTDPAVVNAQYWFVDENGTVVQRTARDMLTTAQLNYSYTQGSDCGATAASSVMAAADVETQQLASGEKRPRPQPVGTTVKVPVGGDVLHITGVQASGSLFEIILVGTKGRRASAGIISTFGDEHHAAAKTYDFDISAQLGLIGAGDTIDVELVPTTGVEDAKGARVAQPTGRISFSQMTITRN